MAWTNTNPTEGVVESDDSYYQPYGMHTYPASNGISSWQVYEWVEFRIRERVTRYSGVTLAQALAMGGDTTTRTPLTQNGTEIFESYSAKFSRRRANPCGGYDVLKTEKWTALYVNGSYVRGAALSVFS